MMCLLLTALSVVLSLSTSAFAQVRWELLGPVAGVPSGDLPPATPPGMLLRMADGPAANALVMADGSTWNCLEAKSQKVIIVTCPPYNAKGDGVTDDSAAFVAAIGTGNRKVLVPPGTYIVALLFYRSNLIIEGAGVGVTTLKLPDLAPVPAIFGNYTSLPVANVEISHLTVDGNAVNQHAPPGYAVVGSNGMTNFNFHDMEVKNSLEYCIGMEYGEQTGKFTNMTVGPCRWDGFDLKNSFNNSRYELTNIVVDRPGFTFGVDKPGVTNAVCVDSGGRNRLTNIRCKGLTNQTYGISFRRHQTEGANCHVPFCEGGDGSSLTNFYVEGDGITTATGAGVLVRDSHVQVSNGYISGMGRGVFVESDPGLGESSYVMVSNVTVMDALTAGFATDTTALYTSFVNCSAINSKAVGAEFLAGSVRFIASAVTNAASHGIVIGTSAVGGAASHVKIEGSTITENGYYGIYIAPDIGNTIITGNTIVANAYNISDQGINTIIQNNYGVKTADNGQVTMPAGATSVVVNHGLAWTPEPSGISLTAMGNSTNDVGMVYIDPALTTATQFTIKSRNAPGGTGLAIGWRAIVKY